MWISNKNVGNIVRSFDLSVFCGPYPKQTYVFASPTGLWTVVLRVPVGCSYLTASIDCFAWSKISFQLFFQVFFFWFLTCVYHIYWISVHWYWNLSSIVIEKLQWTASKMDIHIFFPCRFVEVHGEGAGFCDFTCSHQYIDWIQGSSSSLKILGGLLAIDL